jgi:3-phenylpropionate/trans-cinnamate dioxygenase ferredoxin reductase subunit
MASHSPTFAIVGASLAGAKAAEALRFQGFDGRILLIGEETLLPYERPPLSKEYLQGSANRDAVFVQEPEWYPGQDIEVRLNTAASAIDRDGHELLLSDGDRVSYDKLLLTTGASPRRLLVPGADADRVLYLRRLEDSDTIRHALQANTRVAIIGGGWIGLEVAAAARIAGAEVTLLEHASLPLLRVLGPEVARVFADLHREHSVDFRFGAQVEEILSERGNVTGVLLADGSRVDADVVVVGIGVDPNTRLAAEAGLEVSDGIVVDASLRTADPDIYAAGDVARAFHPLLGQHIRVEHWANARNQPATAALAMLGDNSAVYDQLPYFFTDQYDVNTGGIGMEYIGYVEPDGYDRVIFRGDTSTREFIAFWLKNNRVLAGMNVNIWDVVEPIQRLIRSNADIDTARLADPDVPLEEI